MIDDNPFDELASSDVLSIDAVLNISDPATYLVRLLATACRASACTTAI